MRTDAGSHSTAASGDQLLPPVFTQWSAHDRAEEPAADHVATPESGERDADATVELDAPVPGDTPVEPLAARLERLAERLRTDGRNALAEEMSRGDRLDAALAGLLAGYLAAGGE